MSSISAVLAAVDAAVEALQQADWTAVAVRDRLAGLEQLETAIRRQRAISHAVIADLDHTTLGAPVAVVIADVLRISRTQARRRVGEAARLAPRTTLTGQPLPAELAGTAAAWHDGILDGEHLSTITGFLKDLPEHLAPDLVDSAEHFLAAQAAELRPDQLQKVAAQLALRLNPDGDFSEADRARKRGFSWNGRQRPDGMSTATLIATPELRAMLEAWMAKFAAPGMGNPADQTPTLTGQPTPEVIDRDTRGHAQRQHDALAALVRGQLGNPRLGRHRGLPVTVIVTATLDQLQNAAGVAVTGGGTLLPIRDVIRMATHAYHYLSLFDRATGRPLWLGRTKRTATADQRIVLHATDRGCTAPGCDMPGYLSEVHHVQEWAHGGPTNIDTLTFACPTHHRLITPGGWRTRKLKDGTTQWLPPPHLPLPPATNTYHHPENMLPQDGGEDAA